MRSELNYLFERQRCERFSDNVKKLAEFPFDRIEFTRLTEFNDGFSKFLGIDRENGIAGDELFSGIFPIDSQLFNKIMRTMIGYYNSKIQEDN